MVSYLCFFAVVLQFDEEKVILLEGVQIHSTCLTKRNRWARTSQRARWERFPLRPLGSKLLKRSCLEDRQCREKQTPHQCARISRSNLKEERAWEMGKKETQAAAFPVFPTSQDVAGAVSHFALSKNVRRYVATQARRVSSVRGRPKGALFHHCWLVISTSSNSSSWKASHPSDLSVTVIIFK